MPPSIQAESGLLSERTFDMDKIDSTPASAAVPKKKKRTAKIQKNLYEQYLADSGSDVSSLEGDAEDWDVLARQEYTTTMDINILIQQTVKNIIQSVCLEDYEGTSRFGDHELICFAAAVKHNSSIVSLQIRYLDVSDVSLVPLCKALENHPSLRALDLSGTRGGDETGKALRHLVCTNPHIIFAQIDDTIVSGKDAQIIEEAMRYNALVCPDPQTNPFHLGLLRKISAIEERENKFNEELEAKPWLQPGNVVEPDQQKGKKSKKVTIRAAGGSKLGAEVCAQFVQGSCSYGSRCKYFHPERTSALRNAAAFSQFEAAESGGGGDGQSVAFTSTTTASGSRVRLRSRLRPAQFTLQPSTAPRDATPPPVTAPATATYKPTRKDKDAITAMWVLSATIAVCCMTLVVYL